MLLFAIRLILVFLGGACLGSIANWAIYTFAWNSRPISPWGRVPEGMPPRSGRDRVPIVGWFLLNREAAVFGPRYWWRPLLLEIGTGVALAALYWWEAVRLGLIQGQLGSALVVPPTGAIHWQFFGHAILLGLMLAASFIDIDEKIIPDAITVPGTLLGLLLATLVPISLLPNVMERRAPLDEVPSVGLLLRSGGPALGPNGDKLWMEPATAVAPADWPPNWGTPRTWPALAVGVGCYWLWCFALAPRIWRGSRGPWFALQLIGVRLKREFSRPPMRLLVVSGTVFIVCVWRFDPLNPTLNPTSTDPISPNGQYRIPTSNPFQAPGQVPEIYAYGFRNPYRFSFDSANGDLIVGDVGQNTVEEIDRVVKGGNYGWNTKEGTFTFNSTTGTVIANSPGVPAGLIDPISGPLGTLEYDHQDGISITGGFVYHGTGIPALDGKYVFGDLALTPAPVRIDGRLFYADLQTGQISEFQLPQFSNGKLPDQLTVHGFGLGGDGELYAMVTNTAANGTGGIVYKLVSFVPEPTSGALLSFGILLLNSKRRRRK